MDVSGAGDSDARGARLKYLTSIRPKSRHKRAQLLLDEGGVTIFPRTDVERGAQTFRRCPCDFADCGHDAE